MPEEEFAPYRGAERHVDDRVEVPKLPGNENVRDNATGQFTQEARRITDPENVTHETDAPRVQLNPWMEEGIALLAKYQRAHTDREDFVTLFDIKQEMVEHMGKCQ
jgi:hypothetical protein